MRFRLLLILLTILLWARGMLDAAGADEPTTPPRPAPHTATVPGPGAGRRAEADRMREAEKDRALELIFADDFECGDTSRWGGRCTLTDLDLPLPVRRRR